MSSPVYSFDPVKAAQNRAVHGIGFEAAERFDWTAVVVRRDTRRDYGEARYVAMARIDGRLHVMVFTLRGDSIRLISLRKANNREIKVYEEANAR